MSNTYPEERSVLQSANAWDEIFARGGRVFLEPHQDMPQIVQVLKHMGGNTVLDLGCGTGRHVVYLAQNGLLVFGLDSSSKGIEATRQWLAAEGMGADLRLQSMMDKLPYEDDVFDAVVSVQAIHQADLATTRGIVAEIGCVLRKGGLLFVTVPNLKESGRDV